MNKKIISLKKQMRKLIFFRLNLKKGPFLFLSFIFCCSASAQNTQKKVDLLCLEVQELNDYKLCLLKIDSAIAISKKINYEKGFRQSSLAKAKVYIYLMDTKSGLKIINDIEPKVIKFNDPGEIALMRCLKGNFFVLLELFDEAKEEFDKSLLAADKMSNYDELHYRKFTIYYAYTTIIEAKYAKAGQIKQAKILSLLKKADDQAHLIVNKELRNKTLMFVCDIFTSFYVGVKDYNVAKKYFRKGIDISKKVKNRSSLGYLYHQMGKMNYQLQEYNNAAKNFQESIKYGTLTGNNLILQHNYAGMALIYEKLNDKNKENYYLKLNHTVTDRIENNKEKAIGPAVVSITDELNKVHNKDKRRFWFYLIGVFIALIILFFNVVLIFRKYKIEKVNRKQLELFLDEKMALLGTYSSKLDDNRALKDVVRLAITCDSAFLIKFNALFPDFEKKILKLEPGIRNSDFKFCCYLKLNFDTKEIARYTGDSVRAVESKKYRLRKRFNISSSEDINLWFSNL